MIMIRRGCYGERERRIRMKRNEAEDGNEENND